MVWLLFLFVQMLDSSVSGTLTLCSALWQAPYFLFVCVCVCVYTMTVLMFLLVYHLSTLHSFDSFHCMGSILFIHLSVDGLLARFHLCSLWYLMLLWMWRRFHFSRLAVTVWPSEKVSHSSKEDNVSSESFNSSAFSLTSCPFLSPECDIGSLCPYWLMSDSDYIFMY